MDLQAVLCDRDGTLIVDVPYNGNPDLVEPMETVAWGLARLRASGLKVAVISNQSGIARGDLTDRDVARVMDRVDELLGPFETIVWCPHVDEDRCRCRKPAPGLVLEAAERLDVDPTRCAVIGDTAADLGAAQAAGARGVLVPNAMTLQHEISQAAEVADSFGWAVDSLLR